MKSIIAVEIDVDPDDELKCGDRCCDNRLFTAPFGNCPGSGFVPKWRCKECLDAETAMMLKTHCKGEEN